MKKFFALVLIMSSVVKASNYYNSAMNALTSAGKNALSTLPTEVQNPNNLLRHLTVAATCINGFETSPNRIISAIPAILGWPIADNLTKDNKSSLVLLCSIAASSVFLGGDKESIKGKAERAQKFTRLRRSQFAALVGATASKALMDTDFFTNSVALLGFGAKGDIAAHIVGMTTSICASYKLAELVQAKFTQQENNNAN